MTWQTFLVRVKGRFPIPRIASSVWSHAKLLRSQKWPKYSAACIWSLRVEQICIEWAIDWMSGATFSRILRSNNCWRHIDSCFQEIQFRRLGQMLWEVSRCTWISSKGRQVQRMKEEINLGIPFFLSICDHFVFLSWLHLSKWSEGRFQRRRSCLSFWQSKAKLLSWKLYFEICRFGKPRSWMIILVQRKIKEDTKYKRKNVRDCNEINFDVSLVLFSSIEHHFQNYINHIFFDDSRIIEEL